MDTMKTVGDIRRANLEALIREFGTLEALASAADTTSVYLSQVRNSTPDVKTKKPREMGSRMARRLEQLAGHVKPAGWMDIEHGTQIAGQPLHAVAEKGAAYRVAATQLVSEEVLQQLVRDLEDIPDALRSKLIDTIHQHAESAREAHEHFERRKKPSTVAAAKHSRRAHRSVRIRIGDGNPAQGALELAMVDDPFSAAPSQRELELYERIAREPKQSRKA